jgi:hypothetical protein
MRFYTRQHRFYCGVDWHARTLHVCVLDPDGQVVYDKSLPCQPKAFLHAVTPCCRWRTYWLSWTSCRAEVTSCLVQPLAGTKA